MVQYADGGTDMFERIIEWWNGLNQQKKMFACGVAFGLIFMILFVVAIIGVVGGGKQNNTEIGTEIGTETESLIETEDQFLTEIESVTEIETESEIEVETEVESESESEKIPEQKEDPQSELGGGMTSQNGASVDISQVVQQEPSNETRETTLGIDVSEYQGNIEWNLVADAGVEFAIIRVGYREMLTGKIVMDERAQWNLQQATKYGIKVGAYFASAAISKEEAIEEANWVADFIKGYKITYPVAFDFERFEKAENRHSVLNKTQRTDVAIAFMDTIKERGYTPMFYASKNGMDNSASWEMSRLPESKYKIWVAQYPSTPYPQTAQSSYSGYHDIWQYTNKGIVPGINKNKNVDMNVAYFGYKEVTGPQDSEAPEVELVKFNDVTPVEMTGNPETNLRTEPNKDSVSNIARLLKTREYVTMIALSEDNKWARVKDESGQILYAWYNNIRPSTYEDHQGINTQFTTVSDKVTKIDRVEKVNLRGKPTTDPAVAEEEGWIYEGDVFKRIGISVGGGEFSKILYIDENGKEKILYCSTQFLKVVEDEE